MLQKKDDLGGSETEFLEDGREHKRAEANRIGRDHHEGELPGESASHEAVEETGMRNGRRVLAADGVIQKVERSDDENAVDGGDPERDFGEFHS